MILVAFVRVIDLTDLWFKYSDRVSKHQYFVNMLVVASQCLTMHAEGLESMLEEHMPPLPSSQVDSDSDECPFLPSPNAYQPSSNPRPVTYR